MSVSVVKESQTLCDKEGRARRGAESHERPTKRVRPTRHCEFRLSATKRVRRGTAVRVMRHGTLRFMRGGPRESDGGCEVRRGATPRVGGPRESCANVARGEASTSALRRQSKSPVQCDANGAAKIVRHGATKRESGAVRR
jgi:hypothetical protein